MDTQNQRDERLAPAITRFSTPKSNIRTDLLMTYGASTDNITFEILWMPVVQRYGHGE
ncbi:unnamed protein product, partial [Nesidiocoris tenuis]